MARVQRLLEELSNAYAPTGFEAPVREIFRREIVPLAHSVETDGLGSVVARQSQLDGVPKIMLAGHMDEVGLMVKYITLDGWNTSTAGIKKKSLLPIKAQKWKNSIQNNIYKWERYYKELL